MSKPDQEYARGFSMIGGAFALRERTSRLLLGLTIGALIFLLFGVQVYQSRQTSVLRERISKSYESRVHIDKVLSLLQDIETGQRGYVLTGNRDFLTPYLAAKSQLEPALGALEASFEEARDLSTVDEIKKASRQKIDFVEQVVGLARQGSTDSAVALVSKGSGLITMDRIRSLVAQLRESERKELGRLLQASSSRAWWSQPLSLGIQGLLIVILAGAYFAHLSNIRRLERASMLAAESSTRQAAIFDAASDAMIVVDESGKTETVNTSARQMFGYSADEMVGIPVTLLFEDKPHHSNVASASTGALPENTIQRLQGKCANGSNFDAEVSSSSVHLGKRVITLLLVRDSTERTMLEKMKGQFVSSVSHELRTPLTSIRGALVILDKIFGGTLEPKPRQLLNMAKSNSERLSKLIDDILDVEKLDSTELHFQFETIDLRDVVTRAAESNHTFATDRGVQLNVVVPDFPVYVEGDAGRLLQALTNLLSNAAKFTPKNGRVTIRAQLHGAAARASVADQGPGIPMEFRPQLFDRFTQASGSQQSSNAGTGLGLAISKSIVERHKGSIGYESILGEGTVFWIELPLAAPE